MTVAILGKLICPVIWLALALLFIVLFAFTAVVHLVADIASLALTEPPGSARLSRVPVPR